MSALKRVKIADILDAGACDDYDKAALQKLFAGRDSVSALSYVTAPIPFNDLMWGLRVLKLVPDVICRRWAIYSAEQVLPIFEARRPGDDRPRKAIESARGYFDGLVSLEHLIKAQVAAYAAASYAHAHAYDNVSASAASAAACAASAAASHAQAHDDDAAAYAYAAAADAADAAADAAPRKQMQKNLFTELRRMLLEHRDAPEVKS